MRTFINRSGVSALALSAFAIFTVTVPASAADFTANAGDTLGAQTVGNNDKGTIAAGGTVSATDAITWTGGTDGVVIDNYGTITATNRAIRSSTSDPVLLGNLTLNNYEDALITSADDAFRINTPVSNGTVVVNNSGTIVSSTGQAFDLLGNSSTTSTVEIYNSASGVIQALANDAIRPSFGTVVIDNAGTISGNKRGINYENDKDIKPDLSNVVSFEVYNRAGGEIIGETDDGIRVSAISGLDTTTGSFLIDNAGLIYSGGGQAIDLKDISSPDAKITIINRATGTIQTANADAIRPGANATVENYGVIEAGGAGSNDGIDWQGHSGVVLNYESGEIYGARHGITSDVYVDVTNYGLIEGRNGSGVGSDGSGVVINHGTIIGAYAGSGNGDGDGVDIDDEGWIENYGTIEGKGAGGVDKDGFANTSEGIAIGRGTIKNYAGALISGADRGILVDDGGVGSATGSVDIYNEGTIQGLGDDPIAITVVGTYGDTLENLGTIIGSIDLGGGVNTLDNRVGGVLEVGTLLGVGAGNTVNNEGTIAPGGDGKIVETSLVGGLFQASTGGLAIDLDAVANKADLIDVSENAELSGSVRLTLANLAIAGGTVTVLTADEVTNNGLSLIASPALQASLVYPDTSTVQISYAVSFAPTGIGLNANQSALGGYLNNAVIADPSSLDEVTGGLLALTTNGEYTAALDQLSPEIYGDIGVSTLYGARTFGNALLSCHPREGAYAAVQEQECLWADVSGRDFQQDRTTDGMGYDERSWGLSTGAQVGVAKDVVLGLAGGFEQGSADTTSGASADVDRIYGGISLKHTSGPWLLAAAVHGGKTWVDAVRPVNFGGLAMLASGEQDVKHLSGRVRAAYQAGGNALYVKPMVDLEVTQLWLGSVAETGGAAALSVASSSETVFSAAPAIEIGGQTGLGHGVLLRPFARGGAIFYSSDEIAISSSFAGGPAGIQTFQTMAQIDRVMATVGAGMEFVWSDSSVLKLHYDGMFGEDTEQHAFGAKASVKF